MQREKDIQLSIIWIEVSTSILNHGISALEPLLILSIVYCSILTAISDCL